MLMNPRRSALGVVSKKPRKKGSGSLPNGQPIIFIKFSGKEGGVIELVRIR